MPHPPAQPAAPAPGSLLWSRPLLQGRRECLIQSQLEEKNRGGEEDPSPKSRSPPGPGHSDRAPFPGPHPHPRPPVWRLWPKLWEDSPSLQVDVKHPVLHRLYLLFSDLCRGLGGGGVHHRIDSWVPVPSAALAPPIGGTQPLPGSRPTHPPKTNSLQDQTAQFLRFC